MIELNKIYNEDCLETMKQMLDEFIDLIVTSPPYDNLREYNGFEFEFEKIAQELFRIIKNGAVVVWIVADATINGSETGTSFKQVLFFKDCGFFIHDTMIYEKISPFPMDNRYHPSFEYMFVLSKGKPKTFNRLMERRSSFATGSSYRESNGELNKPNTNAKSRIKNAIQSGETSRKNIWRYAVGGANHTSDEVSFGHPATFPEKLAAEHIYSWSNEQELIYDPFMGSGTTAVSALKYKRNFIGSEISKNYCDIANIRIKNFLSQQVLF